MDIFGLSFAAFMIRRARGQEGRGVGFFDTGKTGLGGRVGVEAGAP